MSPSQRPDPMPFQMRSVNLNFPGTIGYSVAFNIISVVSIVSHRRNEVATASLYKDANPGCLWIYMPISEGEYVTDVSRRITYIIERPRIGLVVSRLVPFLFVCVSVADVLGSCQRTAGKQRCLQIMGATICTPTVSPP